MYLIICKGQNKRKNILFGKIYKIDFINIDARNMLKVITISISFVNRFNIASIVLSLSLIDNLRTILLFAVVVSIRQRIKKYPTFLVWDLMTSLPLVSVPTVL